MVGFEVDDTMLEKVLIDHGLDPEQSYEASDKEDVDLTLAELCLVLLTTPDFNEGGLSMNIDRKQLITLRRTILRKYGIEDETESIIDGEAKW